MHACMHAWTRLACLHELHEHVDLVLVLERAQELQDEGVRAGGQDVLSVHMEGRWEESQREMRVRDVCVYVYARWFG